MADIAAQTSGSEVSQAIHNHHQEILRTLEGHVNAIVSGDENANPAALVEFLKDDLLPHARGEEAYLYPAVDPLVKAHGSATATMTVDHEFIAGYIKRIEEAAAAVRRSNGAGQPTKGMISNLQRLCLQLEAVLELHLEKEERVYIPLFEKYLPEGDQQRVLDGMHEAYSEEPGETGGGVEKARDLMLDVRTIAPRERHQLIFDTFGQLRPGEAFVLVNDHDPKPLYYQFSAELTGLFGWDYLEQGPEVWRVRIARLSGA